MGKSTVKRIKLHTMREKKLDFFNCRYCGTAVLGKTNRDNGGFCPPCKRAYDKGLIEL